MRRWRELAATSIGEDFEMVAARAGTIDIGSFLVAQLARRPEPRQRVGWLERNKRVRALAASCGATIVSGGWGPAFNPVEDEVMMPWLATYWFRRIFVLQATYAVELAHELVHWSGHPKRLARPRHRERFDEIYAREELVAEIGAVLMCFDLGMTRHPGLPNARYLNHFLASLPNPQVELEVAFAAANQATAFLLARARSGRSRSWTG